MNEERQRIERAGGRARRARLTPAPGSDPSPEAPVPGRDDAADDEGAGRATSAHPDDERLRREKPPHWG
jgi:hypothetical protein